MSIVPPLIISVCNTLFSHNMQEIFDILLNITLKDGTSGHNDIGSRIQDHLQVFFLDAAVNLDIRIQSSL